MANFVDCIEEIKEDQINNINEPIQNSHGQWVLSVSYKAIVRRFHSFNTQEEAQAFYDKLRGKTSEDASVVEKSEKFTCWKCNKRTTIALGVRGLVCCNCNTYFDEETPEPKESKCKDCGLTKEESNEPGIPNGCFYKLSAEWGESLKQKLDKIRAYINKFEITPETWKTSLQINSMKNILEGKE